MKFIPTDEQTVHLFGGDRRHVMSILAVTCGGLVLMFAPVFRGIDPDLRLVLRGLGVLVTLIGPALALRLVDDDTGTALGVALGYVIVIIQTSFGPIGSPTDLIEMEYAVFRGLVLITLAAFIALGPVRGASLSLLGLAATTVVILQRTGDVNIVARTGGLLLVAILMMWAIAGTLESARTDVRSAEVRAELAFIDDLTGLPNRRQMMVHLRAAVDRAVEGNGQGGKAEQADAVVLFDLDHFKLINDTYGHDVGDDVLRKVAVTIRTVLRETDVFGRWGGEEFLLLLTGDGESTEQVAERCRRALHGADIHGVTASFGHTRVRPAEEITTILQRVDGALYDAKDSGRNRLRAV